ncbi:MAG: acyl-CoA thioesterase [Bacteroidia bacterium]|nr:acyl-CoA thioesterase [Bacteroidia bacterium]MCF8447026.1 acyl-CoA thioesterase [Bacteroidia bacterium]
MYSYSNTLRVRYAETDQMGYVYYGNYAQYYEVARVECLRSMGLSYKMFEDMGIMMPVISLNSKYLKPAKYDDLLTITTSIKELPGVRIHFFYDIYNAEGILLNQGETTLVCINMQTNRPCGSPQILLDNLKSFFDPS